MAASLFHDVAFLIVVLVIPEKSASIVLALTGFGCFVLIVYSLCQALERLGWYIRV